jgi:hypothetical protein
MLVFSAGSDAPALLRDLPVLLCGWHRTAITQNKMTSTWARPWTATRSSVACAQAHLVADQCEPSKHAYPRAMAAPALAAAAAMPGGVAHWIRRAPRLRGGEAAIRKPRPRLSLAATPHLSERSAARGHRSRAYTTAGPISPRPTAG